ncbi:DUF1015 domain-containing protein [bacterium]|nr:DUF1015 domain-containing protein [bacterium]
MIHIKPFRGMRPVPEKISEVASPPWDVLSSTEAREKAKDNPNSFLHVIRPEIDFAADIESYNKKVYAKGTENLQKLINQGILIQDEKPHFYIYKLRMNTHEQVGLVATASVEDYLQGKIKKHEHTLSHKASDRANHVDILNAQTGPVFLTYHAREKINDLIKRCLEEQPIYDFIGDYDVQHTFYIVSNETCIKEFESAFLEVDALYIADGHHRSAAAARVYEKRKTNNPKHTGNEPYNYYLTVIFPDSHIQILEYNRVVRDLNGHTPETLIQKITERFEIEHHPSNNPVSGQNAYKPTKPHTFGMYLEGKWYHLSARGKILNHSNPIDQLDVSILQDNLLAPILGIADPRTDKRIQFVGGIRGLSWLEELVNRGKYRIAFSLYPTSIKQLMSIADACEVMPPKSTWFEPKLASGVVIHMLD